MYNKSGVITSTGLAHMNDLKQRQQSEFIKEAMEKRGAEAQVWQHEYNSKMSSFNVKGIVVEQVVNDFLEH